MFLTESLNIPFVTAFGVAMIGVWIVIVPIMRCIGRRLEKSRLRVLNFQQVIDMYDDGQYRYEHEQGKKYGVKRKSKQPLLPRELTDLPRYLKWTRRDAARDRHIEGVTV